ncbi:S8 family peptidase [Peribacillus sp. FSL K6-1552]|uniref:S8 family peptidase n=1 Tax=Peribacillus sp. FSL K6-1552 TaxID=2954514 RepID=UPI0030F5B98D
MGFKDIYLPNIIQIGADHKWDQNITGKNVVVSVLDTGVDELHPNLSGQVIGGLNFTNDYQGDVSIYKDNNGHGTHVSGIITGKFSTDNNVVGVAPEARILALKVLDMNGIGNVKSLIEAIHYSIDWRGPNQEKVEVINISLGVKQNDPELHEAVKKAVEAQIPVVTAAGNYGDGNIFSNEYLYPGAYQEVIEVGAVDRNNKITSFTNTNEQIDIYAPGVHIVSTYLNGDLITYSGTSMAAPHVSGAIALLKDQVRSNRISLNESEIFSLLCKNTKPMNLSNKEIEGCGALYLS